MSPRRKGVYLFASGAVVALLGLWGFPSSIASFGTASRQDRLGTLFSVALAFIGIKMMVGAIRVWRGRGVREMGSWLHKVWYLIAGSFFFMCVQTPEPPMLLFFL